MHRNRAPFWIRSIRRRPAAVVVLSALAALATVVSVLAPMLLRAVQQTALDEALDHAGVPGTSIAASADYDVAQEQPAGLVALVRDGALQNLVRGGDGAALADEPVAVFDRALR
ncbi:hypothetical protein E9228_003324 [Curtobacterium flaccumfaciens]|uniref:ABC transporter permease n=1 Tax=Curtobacterium salicis TaxID=1779862 RepID=A0ABX0TFY7_9MICO|nr:hypothetical protein [Curtobacterium sp. WW7]NII42650.1 hypothetical protein [Curtobacterium sp. WW7]